MCRVYANTMPLYIRGLVAQTVKRLSTMQETQVQSLGQEDPLEQKMAIHSSTIAWKIPWTEEPGRLQSMGSQRVGHDWATSLSLSFTFIYKGTWTSVKFGMVAKGRRSCSWTTLPWILRHSYIGRWTDCTRGNPTSNNSLLIL